MAVRRPSTFAADEVAREHALEEALVVAAGGVAGGGRAAVAGGGEFEGLRLGRAHAARDEAQALRALLHIDDGAHQVALVAPELEQAAAVRLGDGVARGAHVEEDAAVFKQRGGGVVGEIGFDDLGQLRGRGGFGAVPAMACCRWGGAPACMAVFTSPCARAGW